MSTIPSWARVGAKVVCVHGGAWADNTTGFDADGPSPGDICTVSGAAIDGQFGALISLREYPAYSPDRGYPVWCFRPLVTIEDDISTHFEALLHVRNPQLEAAE